MSLLGVSLDSNASLIPVLATLIQQVKYLLRGKIELPMCNLLERCDSVTENVTDA